jgi:prepilin-type N-terminal cleavage/methylation domain-containing protein
VGAALTATPSAKTLPIEMNICYILTVFSGVFMRHGFTLIELSIVLVILGLLVSGVLLGQDLIRAAELRSVPTDFQKYQTAVNIFRDKYRALPGDMRNATDFWGENDPNLSTCRTTEGSGTDTCNGDGDGVVE